MQEFEQRRILTETTRTERSRPDRDSNQGPSVLPGGRSTIGVNPESTPKLLRDSSNPGIPEVQLQFTDRFFLSLTFRRRSVKIDTV